VVAEAKAPSSPAASVSAAAAAAKDVKLLVDQGRQFFDVGDLIAARILFLRAANLGDAAAFLRAANLGDAAAAVAMGATYDPVVLAERGVLGPVADLDKARKWYERAREMGSPEGPRRLEMLANR
jgi:TPR repeat protein